MNLIEASLLLDDDEINNEDMLKINEFETKNNRERDEEKSEEFDDDEDDDDEEDEDYEEGAEYNLNDVNNELRNYDEEQTNESADEFFLISTPSPFNLAYKALDGSGGLPQEFELIDQENLLDESGDELDNDFGCIGGVNQRHQLRYQTMYEVNRLSNIIEEEEVPNTSEDAITNTTTTTTTTTNDLVKAPSPAPPPPPEPFGEPQSNYLDKTNVESFKEMLILGEEVAQLYKNIESELSKPMSRVNEVMAGEYRPVMKKRVYNLNSGYMTSVANDNDENFKNCQNLNSQTNFKIKTFEPDDKSVVDYYRSAGRFEYNL